MERMQYGDYGSPYYNMEWVAETIKSKGRIIQNKKIKEMYNIVFT